MKPLVTVIGTCRVHDPLKKMEDKGLLKLNNNPINQFVHNTDEIIQRISLLTNNIEYPENLKKFIFDESKFFNSPTFEFEDSDIIIIEVSSGKMVSFGNHHLQMNRLVEYVKNDKANDFKKWMRKIRRKTKDGQIYEPFEGEELSENPFKMLNQLNLSLQNIETLSNAIKEILHLTNKKIIIVNHINLPKYDGTTLSSREELCLNIEILSNELGFDLFNPAKIIIMNGRGDILKDNGKDINHYSNNGLQIIGHKLIKKINNKISKMELKENKI
tara:strand:+ start:645 stop:1463 length:819 start_codon:yes stop_codon:yes gene_type:complete